jgi:hypothetical protein
MHAMSEAVSGAINNKQLSDRVQMIDLWLPVVK